MITRLWRWSIALTAPLALLTLLWLVPAWHSVRSFILVHPARGYRSSDVDLNLALILKGQLNSVREDLRATAMSLVTSGRSPLPTVDLLVSSRAIARLNRALPRSGKEAYVPGELRYPDGEYRPVKVRYRGESLHHWGLAAKSWRIRTRRDAPLDGYRVVDLVVPRWRAAASYLVPYAIAHRLGVLAPDVLFVNLRVNGRQHGGIHMLLPRVGETFLRRHNRLPEDLYVGDMVLGDAFPREQETNLWSRPWLWHKAAYDNRYPRDSRQPLEEMVRRAGAVRDEASHGRLAEMLDLDAWARLSAWMQLVGAVHMDRGHNWALLYDRGSLRFEPVIIDGNGLPDDIHDLAAGVPGLDLSVTTPVLERLHYDHRFLRLKADALARFFRDGMDAKVLDDLDKFGRQVAASLAVSRQIDWIGTTEGRPVHYVGPREFGERLASYRATLRRWFDDQRAQLRLEPGNLTAIRFGRSRVRLRLDGYAPAAELRVPFAAPGVPVVRLVRAGAASDISRFARVRDGHLVLGLPLLAEREVVPPQGTRAYRWVTTRPTTYDLELEHGRIAPGPLVAVDLLGHEVEAASARNLPPTAMARTNMGTVPAHPTMTRWAGAVEVSGTVTVRGDLTVAPGTRVALRPGANVIVRGRLLVEGTPDAPVAFVPAEPGHPWGTVAVVGPGADGSVLRHCQVSGGSGFITPLAFFSGMISIHLARGVVIDRCTFRDNREHDDLLHAVYSEIDIRDSAFLDAHADAIDLDITAARLENVTVARSGNDALDLMTSRVTIVGGAFTGAGDKGLSIGEASTVAVRGTRLVANRIGIEAKDGSQVTLFDSEFRGNGVHVSSYRKSLHHPGETRVVAVRASFDEIPLAFEAEPTTVLYLLAPSLPAGWARPARVWLDPPAGSPARTTAEELADRLARMLGPAGRPAAGPVAGAAGTHDRAR